MSLVGPETQNVPNSVHVSVHVSVYVSVYVSDFSLSNHF